MLASMLAFFLAGCATTPVAHSPSDTHDISFKRVSLDEFMNNKLSVSIPITLSIPASYIHADIEAPLTYSYWMPKDKVAKAKENQDLPADTGWIYGNISLSVGYDQTTCEFFGDDGHSLNQVLSASGYRVLVGERIVVNGHPVLFLYVEEKKTGKRFYTLYIAMMLETNNIFIAYRPPLDDAKTGAYVWSQLVKTIKESNQLP
jgi:hypothetical protein